MTGGQPKTPLSLRNVPTVWLSNIVDSVHANGRFTLGENIADQGGLMVAHLAYLNSLEGKETPAPIDGFTNEQRFYLGYANLWAQNIRPEEILRLTKIDPHSLGKWRATLTLSTAHSISKKANRCICCRPTG